MNMRYAPGEGKTDPTHPLLQRQSRGHQITTSVSTGQTALCHSLGATSTLWRCWAWNNLRRLGGRATQEHDPRSADLQRQDPLPGRSRSQRVEPKKTLQDQMSWSLRCWVWTCLGPVTPSVFLLLHFGTGKSVLCLEAHNLSGFTGSQMERDFASGWIRPESGLNV